MFLQIDPLSHNVYISAKKKMIVRNLILSNKLAIGDGWKGEVNKEIKSVFVSQNSTEKLNQPNALW